MVRVLADILTQVLLDSHWVRWLSQEGETTKLLRITKRHWLLGGLRMDVITMRYVLRSAFLPGYGVL